MDGRSYVLVIDPFCPSPTCSCLWGQQCVGASTVAVCISSYTDANQKQWDSVLIYWCLYWRCRGFVCLAWLWQTVMWAFERKHQATAFSLFHLEVVLNTDWNDFVWSFKWHSQRLKDHSGFSAGVVHVTDRACHIKIRPCHYIGGVHQHCWCESYPTVHMN